MTLLEKKKHLLHCCLFFTVFGLVQYAINGYIIFTSSPETQNETLTRGNIITNILLLPLGLYNWAVVVFRLLSVLMSCFGLLFYNCFPSRVRMKNFSRPLPLISFRVVTQGDHSELIAKNIALNKNACSEAGLQNYVIEILTEKPIFNIGGDPKVKQIVVPTTYTTKRGTLFKGRNLQYCLEEGVSCLGDKDWIVHLDEDSRLTPDVVCGVANFVYEDKHQFGQGCITYDPDNVTSYSTKFVSASRLMLDFGAMRFNSYIFHQANGMFKGSFVVCKVKAEKDVGFDGGIFSSVTEFAYLSLIASQKGYTFGWVDGEMKEQGALTVSQFMQQHVRTFYGVKLLLRCPDLDKKTYYSFLFGMYGNLYCLPPYLFFMVLDLVYGCPLCPNALRFLLGFLITHDVYVGIFGLLKMELDSKALFMIFLVINLLVGFVCNPLVYTICVIRSFLESEVQFKGTNKNSVS